MQGALLLDVVVRKSAAILELLSGEDKSLLVRWDSCEKKKEEEKKRVSLKQVSFFLSEAFDRKTGVAQEEEEWQAPTKALCSLENALVPNTNPRKLGPRNRESACAHNKQNRALPLHGCPSLAKSVLYARRKHLRSVCLPAFRAISLCSRLFLVSAPLSFFLSLPRLRTFLVLDLSLDVLNGVGRLNLKGDGLSGKGLHENLHLDSLT